MARSILNSNLPKLPDKDAPDCAVKSEDDEMLLAYLK